MTRDRLFRLGVEPVVGERRRPAQESAPLPDRGERDPAGIDANRVRPADEPEAHAARGGEPALEHTVVPEAPHPGPLVVGVPHEQRVAVVALGVDDHERPGRDPAEDDAAEVVEADDAVARADYHRPVARNERLGRRDRWDREGEDHAYDEDAPHRNRKYQGSGFGRLERAVRKV